MNPRLDENEAELAVLVLAVALKVLSHGDSLFFFCFFVLESIKRRGGKGSWEDIKKTFLISM